MVVRSVSAVSVARRLTRGALRTTQNRLQRLPGGAYRRKCEFVSLSYSPVRRKRRRTSTAFSEVGEAGSSRTVVAVKEEEEHEELVQDMKLEQEPDKKDGFQAATEVKDEKVPVLDGCQDATVEAKEEKSEGSEEDGFQEAPDLSESQEVMLKVALDVQLEAPEPDRDSDVCQFKPFPLALHLESESDEVASPSQVTVNGDASSLSPVSAEPSKTLKEEDAKGEVLEKDCQEKVVQKALYFGSPGYDAESCFRRKKEYGWVKSGSRFAAFLRSAVGACEVPGVEHAIPKAKEKSFGDSDHGCGNPVSSSAKKDEPATFPGKRKISLSPRSQLELVKASNSSSYRRMMPFWNELAKNLDGTVDVKCAQQTLPNSNAIEEKISDSKVAFDDEEKLASSDDIKPLLLSDIKLEANITVSNNDPPHEASEFQTPGLTNRDIPSNQSFSEAVQIQEQKCHLVEEPTKEIHPGISLSEEQVGQLGSNPLVRGLDYKVNQRSEHNECHSGAADAQSETVDDITNHEYCISPLPSLIGCNDPLHKGSVENDNSIVLFNTPASVSDNSIVLFNTPASVSDNSIVLFDTPASVPFKGILKASPRACKGLCMCLDCSYFRTHAEKSAEFSERQLHDVEALVTPVINELGRMRRLLDKSLPNEQGRSEMILHSEVNEASRRALKVERAAKTRLKKLSRDYNTHCKIMRMQRRQVKFADKIDVKLFSD